jgi:hypothetical protein
MACGHSLPDPQVVRPATRPNRVDVMDIRWTDPHRGRPVGVSWTEYATLPDWGRGYLIAQIHDLEGGQGASRISADVSVGAKFSGGGETSTDA